VIYVLKFGNLLLLQSSLQVSFVSRSSDSLLTHRCMNVEWLHSCDILENVSKIAVMEHRSANASPNTSSSSILSSTSDFKKKKSNIITSPSSKQPSSTGVPVYVNKSSVTSGKGTLWEREEYCVRYILEESKANMLLRLLTDFKQAQKQVREGVLKASDIAHKLQLDENALLSKMRVYEESVGVLLKHCYMSIEVLQTTDLNHLIDHIALVVDNALGDKFIAPSDKDILVRSQEILAFEYLRLLSEDIENLNEQSISSRISEKGILLKGIRFLDKFYSHIYPADAFIVARALSIVLDLEYFQTNREKELGTEQDKKLLISLYDKCIKDMLTNYETKKALRGIVDTINRVKCTVTA
jgi:hypothetical protein